MKLCSKIFHFFYFLLGLIAGLAIAHYGYRLYVAKIMQRGIVQNTINYLRGRI